MPLQKVLSLIVSCLFCLTLSVGTAVAIEGDALTLTSSTVVDGDTNLSVLPVIELQFSGKVDDITVLEQNKDCFHLQDETGAVLPLMVHFPDVQVQNRFENHVFVTPQMPLAPNTGYTLTIDAALSDKKENTLDQSYRMSFTTGTDEAYARSAKNEDFDALGQDILSYETALPPAAAVGESATETAEEASASSSSAPTGVGIIIVVLILLLGAVGLWNYRSSHRPSTDE